MRKLKHLPVPHWPNADHEAFARAYQPGDIFDVNRGLGAHLSQGWRRMIETTWRRWLGFLVEHHPAELPRLPQERLTRELVRSFVEHLAAEVRATTVAMSVANLHAAARLIAPAADWRWLASLKTRLSAVAEPQDRFDRLVPPPYTLDLGMEMMNEAGTLPSAGKRQELHYRDGLIIALISVWPKRRRSIAALTVTRHLEFDKAGLNILLFPEDTKSRREESFRVPEKLLPYLLGYLKEIRPRLLRRRHHDGLWASYKGCPLTAGQLYSIARARVFAKFGKTMGLHDFRRAAATFIATDLPAKIGLIPGVLQHSSPEVSEQHYNLARSMDASRRFAAHLARTRAKLRPIQTRNKA
jgi:integrase